MSKDCAGKTSNGACPTKPELYKRIKARVKKKMSGDWPSAYGSAQVVKQYKKAGGGYK